MAGTLHATGQDQYTAVCKLSSRHWLPSCRARMQSVASSRWCLMPPSYMLCPQSCTGCDQAGLICAQMLPRALMPNKAMPSPEPQAQVNGGQIKASSCRHDLKQADQNQKGS